MKSTPIRAPANPSFREAYSDAGGYAYTGGYVYTGGGVLRVWGRTCVATSTRFRAASGKIN